jgi:hypothetical protein
VCRPRTLAIQKLLLGIVGKLGPGHVHRCSSRLPRVLSSSVGARTRKRTPTLVSGLRSEYFPKFFGRSRAIQMGNRCPGAWGCRGSPPHPRRPQLGHVAPAPIGEPPTPLHSTFAARRGAAALEQIPRLGQDAVDQQNQVYSQDGTQQAVQAVPGAASTDVVEEVWRCSTATAGIWADARKRVLTRAQITM